MSPAASVQDEAAVGSFLHVKPRTVQMRLAQYAPDFQFLAENFCAIFTNDFQACDASRCAAFKWFDVNDFAEVDAGFCLQQFLQRALIERRSPTIKIFRLLVVIVQNCLQQSRVVGVAIRTINTFQIIVMHWLPTVFKGFRLAAATFGKPRVAYFAVVGEENAACFGDSLFNGWIVSFCDALIALAVVVGADVK